MLLASPTIGGVIGVGNVFRRDLWNRPSTRSLPGGSSRGSKCAGPHEARIYCCRSACRCSTTTCRLRFTVGIPLSGPSAKRNWRHSTPKKWMLSDTQRVISTHRFSHGREHSSKKLPAAAERPAQLEEFLGVDPY